ncbi:MAG: 2-amino-4-hydroxy-6-hydroxymethyldihydropteridine diphosphokinase [Desulfovibrio sp.]|nr:2-amino-4-hydroxy-6-hydroxymethyldihydropteridine diphosphokinase [Desulfovibrio sp.]
MAEEIFVGLGSNLGEPEENVARAAEALTSLAGCECLRQSAIYMSSPQGYTEQPWFANAVICLALHSTETPQAFLTRLLELEGRLGRVRDGVQRFGPRRIDLDLLLFGQRTLSDTFCTLPHPRMLQRAFVLCPLHEIAPDLVICGKTASEHLAGLDWHREGLRIFQESHTDADLAMPAKMV